MTTKKKLAPASPWVELRTTMKDWDAADPALLTTMATQLHLIRAFEESVLDLAGQKLINGPAHSSIGQEGGAVGSILPLTVADQINGSHRGHHQFLAKALTAVQPDGFGMTGDFSGEVREVLSRSLSEICGLAAGYCGGRGGSMHLQWKEIGAMGTNAIVGGAVPFATGFAWSDRHAGTDAVSVTYFGDGAMNIGSVLESLNLASAWSLPVCFFVENNQYAVTTSELIPTFSITKSAYRVSGFSALDTAIGELGALLRARLPSWGPGLQTIVYQSQKYGSGNIQSLKDLVNFTTLLNANITDAAVISAANNVISAATSTSFRIAYLWNNGSATLLEGANDVSGSQGLNIVFPSGVGEDNVDTQGSRSVSEFTDAMPTTAWSAFLVDWANLITPHPIVDQGQGNALQMYEVWDTVSFNAGADVDFWLVEPDGNVSVPYLGTVTSNGTFTPDSHDMNTYYEGWHSRRVVQSGTYTILAHQISAPQDLTTVVDLVYRSNVSGTWEHLYAEGSYPTLDQTARIEDDVSISLEKLLAGHYSNFKLVATWTPIAASSAAGAAIAGQTLPSGRPALAPVDAALTEQSLGDQAPDPEAMARLLQMIKEKHVDRGQGGGIDLDAERPPDLPLSSGPRPPPAPRLPGNWN